MKGLMIRSDQGRGSMFVFPYVHPELGYWYIIRKVKGYPCYKIIGSVSSEAHVPKLGKLIDIINCKNTEKSFK